MSDVIRTATDFTVIALVLVGVWQFRSPRGALRGNAIAAAALALAICLVAVRHDILEPGLVAGLLVVGAAVGFWLARKVNMLQAPAMVAIQHGAGGLGAFLVCSIELMRGAGPTLSVEEATGIVGLAIGAITFSGSLVAGAKLANVLSQPPQSLRGHGWWLTAAVVVLAAIMLGVGRAEGTLLAGTLAAAVLFAAVVGILISMRIGGADMPVLISFLNATAGVAAAFTGVVIGNNLLVAGGATVAASGSVLTLAMCRAMNRNLFDILVGGVGVVATGDSGSLGIGGVTIQPEAPRSVDADPFHSAVTALRLAESVIIVPGYGMALAGAQFATVALSRLLEAAGKRVRFAIHPVAGRMPGHMHVLLSEAEAGWESLVELPDINSEFATTDVCMVIGASDVVNPAASRIANTPISGMPILNVFEARHFIVVNLDEKPGYSGVPNLLYDMPGAILLWGDAKTSLQSLLTSLKTHA